MTVIQLVPCDLRKETARAERALSRMAQDYIDPDGVMRRHYAPGYTEMYDRAHMLNDLCDLRQLSQNWRLMMKLGVCCGGV